MSKLTKRTVEAAETGFTHSHSFDQRQTRHTVASGARQQSGV
jgi:hypothetical protein